MKRLCIIAISIVGACQAADTIPTFPNPFGVREKKSRRITIEFGPGDHARALLHINRMGPIEPGDWIPMETFADHTPEQIVPASKNLTIALDQEQSARIKIRFMSDESDDDSEDDKESYTMVHNVAGRQEICHYNRIAYYKYSDSENKPHTAMTWKYMKEKELYGYYIEQLKSHVLLELLRHFKQNAH